MRAMLRVLARPLGVLCGVLLCAVMLSACTSISQSGPVVRVPSDEANDQSTVRYVPAGPVADATPEQIVRGYIDAMLAYPASPRTAASFLTTEAAGAWNPARRMIEYSSVQVTARKADSRALDDESVPRGRAYNVPVQMSVEATYDQRGQFSARHEQDTVVFRVVEQDGQWRISNPLDAMLVNDTFVRDYVRVFNLYFFDRPGERLIATPVHMVMGDQLATSLVTSLVRGVPRELRSIARTYVPASEVLRPSVPVSADNVADVEFTATLNSLGTEVVDRLSAQLVWTLRQVPGVTGVRIVGDDTQMVDGRAAVQSINSWGGYGPRIETEQVLGVHDGKVVRLRQGKMSALAGSWGKDARGVVDLAISDDEVAGTLVSRALVRVTEQESDKVSEVEGSSIVDIGYDDAQTLWIVDRPSGGVRVRLRASGKLSSLETSALRGIVVDSFDLSPDESRYVIEGRASGREQVWTGLVMRDRAGRPTRLARPRVVDTPGTNPREVSWTSPTTLVYLVDAGEGQLVRRVRVDGSVVDEPRDFSSSFLSEAGITSLVSGRSDRPGLYATDRRDRLWFKPHDNTWRVVSTSKVTALSSGG